MRLSDVKGERVLDVVAEIADPVASIMMDEDAAELFGRKPVPDGMDAKTFFLQRARKAVPKLLKGHKDDVVAVMSAIEGVSREEYLESLTLDKLIADVFELMTDRGFDGFLASQRTRGGDAPSGSASETTGGQGASGAS